MRSLWVSARDAVGGARHACALAFHRAVVAAWGGRRARGESPAGDVLVVKPDNLGDFVLFSVAFPALRLFAAGRRLVLLCRRELADFVSLFPGAFDEVVTFDRRRYRHRPLYRLRVLARLRRRGFGTVLHPVYSRDLVGDELALSSGAAERIAFAGDTSNMPAWALVRNDRLYDRLVPAGADGGRELERYRLFAGALAGSEGYGRRWPRVEAPPVSERLGRMLPEPGLFVVLCPGAFADYRRWPTERYARLVRWIHQRWGLVAVVCGTAAEEPAARAIALEAGTPVVSLCGRTGLADLAAVFARAGFCVGAESGAVHLASAAGAPTVCIIGGGHFGRFYPWAAHGEEGKDGKDGGNGEGGTDRAPAPQVPVAAGMDCFGCNWRCRFRRPLCVEAVRLEQVTAAVECLLERILERAGTGGRPGRPAPPALEERNRREA